MSRLDRLARRLETRPRLVVEDPHRKEAAVAIVAAPGPDALLLIRRAEREGDRWSGQMAFPGGRRQPDDPDLIATAKRETLEEVGLDLSDASLIGILDDVAPRTPTLPPVIVRPFVFRLPERRGLVPNHEVAAAFWADVDQLAAAEVYRPFEYRLSGSPLLFPGYHLPEGVVWGMTERILTPLLRLLTEGS